MTSEAGVGAGLRANRAPALVVALLMIVSVAAFVAVASMATAAAGVAASADGTAGVAAGARGTARMTAGAHGDRVSGLSGMAGGAVECANWQETHPDWIFCDDFEDETPLVRPGRYFEVGDDEGDFARVPGVGVAGSAGMRTRWQTGEVGAGGLKVSFGRNPNEYIGRSELRIEEDFREIWYRMYLRMEPGWQGSPAKLSRATVFTSASDWRQAMIAHLWSDDQERLLIDPARCVGEDNRVECTTYNDFDRLDWLGYKSGVTPLFATEMSGRWFCVEAHVKLNDPGAANGVQEFFVDDQLEARRDELDFVRAYTDYAINAVFFENYWNDGSPRDQERYFDNIVISESPIGCLELTATPGASPTATSATPPASPTSPATATPHASPTPGTPAATTPTVAATPTATAPGDANRAYAPLAER